MFRSFPRKRLGIFRFSRVAIKLPPHPEEAVESAFTRVCDALWLPSRRMAGIALPATDLGFTRDRHHLVRKSAAARLACPSRRDPLSAFTRVFNALWDRSS